MRKRLLGPLFGGLLHLIAQERFAGDHGTATVFRDRHLSACPATRELSFCEDPSVAEDLTLSRIEFAAAERFLSLRRGLGVRAFGLNQLTLKPGQRGRIHRHRFQEEVYLVLAGALTLVVDEEPRRLGTGELARVPARLRRQLENRGLKPCVVLAIGAAGEHVGRDGEAFESWEESDGRAPQNVPLPDDLPASVLQ